ncbi:MAG: nuclear transport factor 2 family protein [Pseudomonadales bacterium]|nr:nuclear transport factor 2 family protein [Pseudomonadales bacterium]
MTSTINELEDKAAIRDVLSRYCRGLDRMDKDMVRGVFAAQCSANYYGIYTGTGHGFIDWVWEAHRGMETHSHQITNVLIELNGDSAVSEAYITVVLQQQRPSGAVEIQVRSRYLDRWSKRDGHWLIIEREHVTDTQSEIPLQAISKSPESRRDRDDASFRFFS